MTLPIWFNRNSHFGNGRKPSNANWGAMSIENAVALKFNAFLLFVLAIASVCSAGCLSPLTNTYKYATSGGDPYLFPSEKPGTAEIRGIVTVDGRPLADAVVLVAEPQGTPHTTRSDSKGEYVLQGLPSGSFIPIAVAAGFEEEVLRNGIGLPWAIALEPGQSIQIPEIQLKVLEVASLGQDAAMRSQLSLQGSFSASSPYPEGASALVQHWSFQRDEVVNDTLYVYLPLEAAMEGHRLPLLFAVYPGHSLMWEDVSIAFASQGFAVVALSPLVDYGRDVIEHGKDARLALHFAINGDLGDFIDSRFPMAVSGSYGSAVLNRLLRLEPNVFVGVAMLGGISNAFSGAAAFYAGDLVWAPEMGYSLVSLGTANAKPKNFMHFSPVYTAEVMPPTLFLHTQADEMVPIEQSYEYAEALRSAGIPVYTYYFEDESHYIKVGENTSLTTRRVFLRVLAFLQKHLSAAEDHPFGSQSLLASSSYTESR